jgi:hypothetical protein
VLVAAAYMHDMNWGWGFLMMTLLGSPALE